jgi:hypothetical protein
MRFLLSLVATVGLIIPAEAGELTREDEVFSRLMLLVCRDQGYVSDDDTPMKNADKMGVDGARMWDASRAAMQAMFDREYDRKDIIPEVTRAVRASIEANGKDAESGKICKWTDKLEKLGWLKKK